MIAATYWRRNLAALWFAEFTAIMGFSFAFPFIPLFLRELGVRNPSALAAWTGVAGGASGIALAVTSPLWGVLADRYGRRSMLLRAMVGGGVTVGLMGLAQAPLHLVLLRLLQGASSGTVAAATALVAGGTPRERVGWAMGVLTSSIAVGSALGPVVGGVLASTLGVRSIFTLGGLLLLLAAVPVLVVVREPAIERRTADAAPALTIIRGAGAGTVAAIAVLLIAQGLVQMSYAAFQPLVVLRLIERAHTATAAITGLTFGLSGLASAVAAVGYARPARRYGYISVAIATAAGMAAAEVLSGFSPAVALIVAGGGLTGFFYGALGPAISSMLGLEVPSPVQARVFGLSASATAIGFGLGPLLGGEAAAVAGLQAGIVVTAALALALALILALRGREPRE